MDEPTQPLPIDRPTEVIDEDAHGGTATFMGQFETATTEDRKPVRDESEITVVLQDIDQAAWYVDHMVGLEDGSIYARSATRGGPQRRVVRRCLHFEIEATAEPTDRGPRITPVCPLYEKGWIRSARTDGLTDWTPSRPTEGSADHREGCERIAVKNNLMTSELLTR